MVRMGGLRGRPFLVSTFDRSSADIADSDATDRLTGDLDVLVLCCREPGADQADDDPVCKTISEHDSFTDAKRTTGKQ